MDCSFRERKKTHDRELTIVPFYESRIKSNFEKSKNRWKMLTHWAAIFFVPGEEAMIMTVSTRVTEKITLRVDDQHWS